MPTANGGVIEGPYDPSTGQFINPRATDVTNIAKGNDFSTLGLAGKLLGVDVLAAIDLGETIGQVTMLATPNLTALSGETATFLAGGEIPIPIAQGLGAVSIEYKQYGVSLAFTPTVLADGRISLRVRPEVSQLSSSGAVSVQRHHHPRAHHAPQRDHGRAGFGREHGDRRPAAEHPQQLDHKTPGLGDVPILGALFRSNGFQRNETELVIVITPYLVKPVNANQIVLPTDGYQRAERLPADLRRSAERRRHGRRSAQAEHGAEQRDARGRRASRRARDARTRAIAPRRRQGCARRRPNRRRRVARAAPGFGF